MGTELTEDEIALGAALKAVKARADSLPRWALALRALRVQPADGRLAQWALQRMQLEQPQDMQQRVVRNLLLEALSQGANEG